MLERELETKCRKLALSRGCRMPKWTSPGNAGVPDRILIGPSTLVFIEFKQVGKNLTARQTVWRRFILACGLRHEVVRTVEEFEKLLPEKM